MSQTDKKKTGNEIKPGDDTPRIGVYICHCGGNISDVVDVEKVVQIASGLPNVVVARNHLAMCSDPGQNMVAEDITQHKLNRVVIAACSPSLHEITFRQTLLRADLNQYLYEHVNIREQVSWCSKSDPEGATDKAIHLVAAAVAKAALLRPMSAIRAEARKHVVVLGGGVSGLSCARQLSQRGLKVTLLEKTAFLGGRMAQLDKVFPTMDKARNLLGDLLAEVKADDNIKIYTQAEVTAASGSVGNFQLQVSLHPRGVVKPLSDEQLQAAIGACPVSVDNEFDYHLSRRRAIYLPYEGCYPEMPVIDWDNCTRCGKCAAAVGGDVIVLDDSSDQIELHAGAIVMATGFDLYEPHPGEYGYGEHKEVITLAQLIRLMDEDGPTQGRLSFNGRPVNNIALIHCVGSRQVAGIHEPGPDGRVNDYCSRVCCTATLQASREIRERFPRANIFDFYQDIRTYGRGHEDYYENASKEGVLFFRYSADSPPVVSRADGPEGTPLLVKVKDTLTFGEELDVPVDLVVLATGMVPRDIGNLVDMLKLPRSADRFLQEVHPKLRPVELAVNGILIAGTCQGPMDITEASAAAMAAAVKASILLSRGYIELDPFVARVDLQLCTGGEGCDAVCVSECSAAKAITLVDKEVDGQKVKKAEVNAALCTGCGLCSAVCPYNAIQVEGWRLDQFEAMVDALTCDY